MTRILIEEKWILPEDEGDFELVFSMGEDVACEGCLVSVTCRWQPVEEAQTFVLYPGQRTQVFVKFNSGYELRGVMKLVCAGDDRTPLISVCADISYDCPGRLPMQYFEGVVFIREVGRWPDPDPDPCPDPDPYPPWFPPDEEPSDEDDQPVVTAPSDELFPFVYMRQWPRASDAHLDYGFFGYDAADGASPPAGGFIDDLARAYPQGRAQMETLALDFILGAPPYQPGQFIASRAGLCEPLRGYAPIALSLQRRQDHCWREEWLDQLCAELGDLLHRNGQTGAELGSPSYRAALDQVWQSYFALVVILGYDRALLSDFALTLWVANAVDKGLEVGDEGRLHVRPLGAGQRALLAEASLVLPATVFPLPAASPALSPPSGGGWVEPYAVGDLQMVRHRLIGYSAGEIARIENVMRGERREVSSRQARQQLDVQQRSGEDEQILESADADERTGLIEEAARTIAGKTVSNDYNNLTASYGPPTNGILNGTCERTVTAGPAGSDDVTRFAREILTKTVNRISRKVGTLRASSTMSQVEDMIVSTVDNSGGGSNLCAIYRWVNKIYEACVVNYGNRLMMEFVVPLPAARFIDRVEARPGPEREAPVPPARRGIDSFADIQPGNYASLCADYGVTDIVPPPQDSLFVTAAVRGGEEAEVAIPAGYCASSALAGFVSTPAGLAAPAVLVGCQSVGTSGTATPLPPLGESATLPVSVAGVAPSLSPPAQPDILVNVEIECTPTSRSMDEWRIGIYAGIVKAYRESLERVLAGHATGALPLLPRSPLACREIERRALRNECTRLLLERAAMLTGAPFLGSPPTPAGADVPRYRQFLDATLEWPEMSYTLLPGDPAGDDGEGDGGDPLFINFLHAAQARVLLPVRPERAIAFLYFFEAGMIWDGTDRLIAVNGPDIDAVDDLKRAARDRRRQRRIGRPWEIVVPTAMQVLDGGGGLGAAGAAL